MIIKFSETYTAEIEAGRIIESSFLEGIGHFLYRRGTNSETILESHNRNYRNQNGTTFYRSFIIHEVCICLDSDKTQRYLIFKALAPVLL